MKSKKNSRFLSFITVLSMLGVGLGVTSMIVVLSVMDGFEAELKKRLMSSDLHILVTPTTSVEGFQSGFVPKDSIDIRKILDELPDHGDSVASFWPVVSTEAILKTGKKVTGIVLKGVNQDRLEKLKLQMVESAESQMLVQRDGPNVVYLPGLIIGQELAYESGLIPGDLVTLISPTETEGPLDSIPRMKKYVVEGVYHSGLPEQELHTVFAKANAVRSFLKKSDVVSQWEVSMKNFSAAPEVAEKWRMRLKHFKVQDWIQLNAHLFASLKLERMTMFVILAVIIVVASFNIVTTLTLMVLEKKKEISILKAMGAQSSQISAIFLAEGLIIGLIGIVVGTFLGFVLCLILKRYEFITLPDIFYDRTLPVTFDGRYYVGVAVCAIFIVVFACIYPSRRAAGLQPLDGIRFG